MSRRRDSSLPCELCGRTTKKGSTAHHLIPVTCHSNKWFQKRFTREQMSETVQLCRECHNAVHRFVPREKELGRHYPTLQHLREHPQIAKFVQWIRKQK